MSHMGLLTNVLDIEKIITVSLAKLPPCINVTGSVKRHFAAFPNPHSYFFRL